MKLSAGVRRLAERPRNTLLEAARRYPDLISLGRGDPDLPTPDHIVAAAKRALDEGHTHYTHLHGAPELRRAIAEKLERDNGIQADPETEILVTTGAQEAVYLVVQGLLDVGDEMLIPDPHYTSYDLAALAAGGQMVPVPTYREDDFVVRPEEIERRITPRTRALAIVSPNNPTGAVYPAEALARIAEVAIRHDLVVVSDEIYELQLFAGQRHASLGALPGMRERTITINGFSKGYAMTGWRVGYIVAPANLVDALGSLHHTLTICPPAFAQQAAVAALIGPQDTVAELVKTFDERQRLFVRGLREIDLDAFEPRGTFYVFVDIRRTGVSSQEFAERLLQEARVLMYPGSYFGLAGEGFARASMTLPPARLREALDRMGAADVVRGARAG